MPIVSSFVNINKKKKNAASFIIASNSVLYYMEKNNTLLYGKNLFALYLTRLNTINNFNIKTLLIYDELKITAKGSSNIGCPIKF